MSTTVTLAQLDDRFPPGTAIAVHFRGAQQHDSPPSGEPLATATVQRDGSATFEVPECRWLTAHGVVGSEHRYVGFSSWPHFRGVT